jgi:hypothetical protein
MDVDNQKNIFPKNPLAEAFIDKFQYPNQKYNRVAMINISSDTFLEKVDAVDIFKELEKMFLKY